MRAVILPVFSYENANLASSQLHVYVGLQKANIVKALPRLGDNWEKKKKKSLKRMHHGLIFIMGRGSVKTFTL